jgi:hypothetical protein
MPRSWHTVMEVDVLDSKAILMIFNKVRHAGTQVVKQSMARVRTHTHAEAVVSKGHGRHLHRIPSDATNGLREGQMVQEAHTSFWARIP